MVSIGSKALPLRRRKDYNSVEDGLMEDTSYNQGRRKRGMNRKSTNERSGFDGNRRNKNVSGRVDYGNARPQVSSHHQSSAPEASFIRKQVDPETSKYFLEIANLFEGNAVDMGERSILCGNALEETRGKELELATDYIISHTLQTLLEGCDVDHLCGFLRSCAKDFPKISMDRSGSHVAETAIKALAAHLQDSDTRPVIEEALTKICQAISVKSVDVMCNCYGSHVLRRLFCLCKGVPLDSSEFHVTKSSAERLNFRESQLDGTNATSVHEGFPDLLKFLVYEMLKCNREDIVALQVNQYSSLVLQTAMKLLVGDDQVLMHIISILIGCNKEIIVEGDVIDVAVVRKIIYLMKEPAASRLMEVILEVAPETLYNGLLTKVFRNSLIELSSDHCGNFVVQALISHARSKGQMEIIWEELGLKFKDILEMGTPGVIASLIAASQRIHTHEQKCSQSLAAAVCSASESPVCIVPRILFLESYFFCEDKSNWNWTSGVKMHYMGSLILQAVFRYRSEFIQPFINSLTSMEADHVFETARDAGGARVLEAFLNSNASGKLKRKLVLKLQGHFGELAMNPSGSFTVETCFTVSNATVRETIMSELVAVRTELSRTRQGPHLSRKLDVDGFATRPDQWRSKQASQQTALNKFHAVFGYVEPKAPKNDRFIAETSHRTSDQGNIKMMRKEIEQYLPASAVPSLGFQKTKQGSEKFKKLALDEDVPKMEINKLNKRKRHGKNEDAAGAGERREDVRENSKSSQYHEKSKKSRRGKDGHSQKPSKRTSKE